MTQRPVAGRTYPIKLGTSMKTEVVGERSHIHTVSYAFRPASVDTTASGAIAFDESEARNVSLEFPNKSSVAASVCLTGKQVTTTKRDCLLLFDPASQCFVLEKIASSTREVKKAPHQFEPSLLPRTTRAASRAAASLASAAAASASASANNTSNHNNSTAGTAVRLDASSASQVKLTSSSVIHRLLHDDGDDDDDASDEDEQPWAI